jgi:uncharacterized protein YndB with AHSA1/START domain
VTGDPQTERLDVENGRYVLRMVRRLNHPPDVVWRAVTEPAQLSRWFPSNVDYEPGADAKIRFAFREGEGPTLDGVVTEYEPPHVIAYSWDTDHLRWEVQPDGDGTLLLFTHTFDDGPGAAKFAAGWETCLVVLEQALDGRELRPPTDWASRHESLITRLSMAGSPISSKVETTSDGWSVRYERQLVVGADVVWSALAGPTGQAEHHRTGVVVTPAVGSPAPSGFVRDDLPSTTATTITAVDAQHLLEYDVRPGYRIRWELRPGPGGARLVLTETRRLDAGETGRAAAEDAAAAWREQIERLAARMLAAAGA